MADKVSSMRGSGIRSLYTKYLVPHRAVRSLRGGTNGPILLHLKASLQVSLGSSRLFLGAADGQ